MHVIPILGEIVIVLTVSALFIGLFQRFGQPAILGFLVSGVLLGPVLGVVQDRERIEVMAEIGIVLLMFSIGVEFSLSTLSRMRKEVLGGGGGQLLVTGLAAFLLALAIGYDLRPALFLGLLVALSSTAIVLRLLGDRSELDAPHGRLSVGILILQDLAVVVLMLLVPILATGAGRFVGVLLALGQALLTAGLIVIAARFAFPWVLDQAVRTRSRELFTLVTVLVALGTAWLMGLAGLSLAIGAFVAGLVVSESPWSHHMMSEMRPLRDVFNGLFFVSVGLLVDPAVLADRPFVILALIPSVMVLKGLIAGGVALALGLGPRVAVLAGGALAQVGEFSFVLAQQGMAAGILSADEHATFIAITVGTMMLTPLVLQGSHAVARRVYGVAGWRGPHNRGTTLPEADHAVIVGFGINGRNVARVLRWLEVPYLVVELNSRTVNERIGRDEPFVFGDATRELVLRHVGIERARVLVVAIADPSATRAIVTAARALHPGLRVVVRTRYIHEVTALHDLGAEKVVPEEYETSIELAAQALYSFGVSPRAVARARTRLRQQSYALLRRTDDDLTELRQESRLDEILSEIDVVDLFIEPGSVATGKTLGQLDLRATTGATVLAVLRGDALEALPHAGHRLEDDDVIVVVGHGDQLQAVRALVTGPPR